MSLRAIALLLAAVANGGLAAFIWWRYKRQRLLRLFAFSVAGVSGYCIFVAGLAAMETRELAVAWVRSTTLLPYLALLGFFKFSVVLARAESKTTQRILLLGWTAAVLDSVMRLTGIASVDLVVLPGLGWFPGPDVVYFFLYTPTMLGLVGGGLFVLWKRLRAVAQNREAIQLTYVFLAMAVGLLLSICNFWPPVAALAAVGPIAYTSIIAFAILQRRLLDIRLLLQRGAIAAAISVSLGFLAVLAIILGHQAWPHGRGGDLIAAIVAGVIFTLSYMPLRRSAENWAERLGSARAWQPSTRLLEFSLLSSAFPSWEQQVAATAQKLVEDFQLENATLILPDAKGALVKAVQAPHGLGFASDPPSPLILKTLASAPQGLDLDDLSWSRYYEENASLLAMETPEDAEARAFLSLNRAHAAFALLGSQKPQGVLLVGPPRSGRNFSDQDMAFFTALAAQLGKAVENQQLHGRVQQADRLSSLGTLAASLTHEIRNPLSSIALFLAMLPKRHEDPDFIERFTRVVGREVERLSQLSDQMLTYAKPTFTEKQSLDLGRLAERTRQLLGYHFAKRQVRLVVHAKEGVLVRGAEAEVSQVLVNLLLNALDASRPEQEVEVRVGMDGPVVLMAVQDQGQGISAEQQARLFEPFFTTKESGTGLGLATCLRIVEDGGGSIRVESQVGKGTVFEVRWPSAGVLRQAEDAVQGSAA